MKTKQSKADLEVELRIKNQQIERQRWNQELLKDVNRSYLTEINELKSKISKPKTYESWRINWYKMTYVLVNVVLLIASIKWLSYNIIIAEQGFSSVIFGLTLALMIFKYVAYETIRVNPIETIEVTEYKK